jgi:pyruvate,water dikinase
MDLVWLDEPACQDHALVGGKAAQLSSMAASHHVPPGFCLTTRAFDHVLAGGLVFDEGGGAPPAPPPALYEALEGAYQILAERCGRDSPSVAVRSSASDEDGVEASFAGQYATYLNVVGTGAIT